MISQEPFEIFKWAKIINKRKRNGPFFARWGHTALALPPFIFLQGGTQPNSKQKQNDCLFRLSLDSFELEKVMFPGFSSRDSHTIVTLSGKHILWGGSDNNQQCITFDPIIGWNRLQQYGEIPSGRESHCSVGVANRWMLMFGGWEKANKKGRILDDFNLYDLQTFTWKKIKTIKGKVPALREGASMTVVGDRIFLFGGQGKTKHNSQLFYNDLHLIKLNNPESVQPSIQIKQIKPEGNLPPHRSNHCAVQFRQRYLVIISGQGYSGSQRKEDSQVLLVESSKSQSSQEQEEDRFSDDVKYLSDVWAFDLHSYRWQEIRLSNPQEFKGRLSFTASVYKNSIFLIGGLKTLTKTHKDITIVSFDEPEPLKPEKAANKAKEKSNQEYICLTCKNYYNLYQTCQQPQESFPAQIRTQISQDFLDTLSKTIRNPLLAIANLVRCELNSNSNLIDISLCKALHPFTQSQQTYLHIKTNSINWTYQQFLQLISLFDHIDYVPSENVNFKDKMDEQLSIRRNYGTILKIAGMRLGKSLLYISKQKDIILLFLITSKYRIKNINAVINPFVTKVSAAGISNERNYKTILQDMGSMASDSFFQELSYSNHIIIYDMYRQFGQYQLTPTVNDIQYVLPHYVQNQFTSLRDLLGSLVHKKLPGRSLILMNKAVDLRLPEFQQEMDRTGLPKCLLYCKQVKLRRRKQKGNVLFYHNGFLVKKTSIQGLEGFIEVPLSLRPNLIRTEFENLKLEGALLEGLARVGAGLARERQFQREFQSPRKMKQGKRLQ